MKFIDILKQANRQLFNRKFQALLPVLSLVVGATTMTFALGAGFGVQEVFEKQLAAERAPHLVKIAPDPNSQEEEQNSGPIPKYEPKSQKEEVEETISSLQDLILSKDDLKTATGAPYVQNASPLYPFNITYVTLEGVDQKFQPVTDTMFPSMEFKMLAGEKTDAKDEVVVTKAFAELDQVSSPENLIGKKLTVTYTDGNGKEVQEDVNISGVRAAGIASAAKVFIPYERTVDIAKAQLQEGEELQPREAVLRLQENLTKEQRGRMRDELKESGFRVLDFAQAEDTVQKVGLYLTLGMAAFAGIVIFAALFGVTNTMSMSVYERVKQIGLMKALGMSSGAVFFLFAVEGALLGFWGAIIGVLIAYVISVLIFNPMLASFFADQGVDTAFQLTFPPLWILAIIMGLMLIAFLASTLPAWRAARMNPINALRYE